MSPAKLMIVDDDREILSMLTDLFVREMFDVRCATNGEGLLRELERRPFDLIILDVMMPGDTGFEICAKVRKLSLVPIMLLTAAGDVTNRVVGLEVGADDYVSKPFEPRELVARTRALLRRSRQPMPLPARTEAAEAIRFQGWRIDLQRQELRTAHGVLVPLSKVELAVLTALAERPNVVMSRAWLRDLVGWPHDDGDRAIDLAVSRLRTKMAPHMSGEGPIETIRDRGYVLTALDPRRDG
jgi:two-component system, OmpR family, response regulator